MDDEQEKLLEIVLNIAADKATEIEEFEDCPAYVAQIREGIEMIRTFFAI